MIGKGGFGEVFKGVLRLGINGIPVGQEVAVKIASELVGKIVRNFEDAAVMREIVEELGFLASLNHPTCLKLIGFSLVGSDSRKRPAIVTKWMPFGSLDKVIENELRGNPDRGWNPTKKSICIFGMILGIKYIHSCGLMHRDIKPQNVFINERFEPVIGDFGLTTLCKPDGMHGLNVGTVQFMARELFDDEDGDVTTQAVDIYAFGISLLYLFTETLEFDSAPRFATSPDGWLRRVQRGVRYLRPPGITDYLWELVKRCWSHRPEDRPTSAVIVEELKSHRSEWVIPGTNISDLEAYENSIVEFERQVENKKTTQRRRRGLVLD
jgi:serine/threonine protein kinase